MQTWAAGLNFPATTSGSAVLYGPMLGASAMSANFFTNALPVPVTCLGSNLNLIMANAPADGSVTFNVMSYNRGDGIVYTGLSCTINTGSGGSAGCSTGTTTATLFFGNIIALQASSFSFGRTSGTITVTASLTCQQPT